MKSKGIQTRATTWSEADKLRLLHLRDELGLKWKEIHPHFPGRSFKACTAEYYISLKDQNKCAERKAEAAAKGIRRPWLPAEVAELLRLRDEEKLQWSDIAARLNRAVGSCSCTYGIHKDKLRLTSPTRITDLPTGLSAEQAAQIAARSAAESRMSLTATIFGDPPPGYSALDCRLAERVL